MEQIWGLVSVRDCGKGPDVEFPVSLGFTVSKQAFVYRDQCDPTSCQ